jgi:hypothetical protein
LTSLKRFRPAIGARECSRPEVSAPRLIGERDVPHLDAAAAIAVVRIAGMFDSPMGDVWRALCNLPVNMASLVLLFSASALPA